MEGRYGEQFAIECDNGEVISFSLTGESPTPTGTIHTPTSVLYIGNLQVMDTFRTSHFCPLYREIVLSSEVKMYKGPQNIRKVFFYHVDTLCSL